MVRWECQHSLSVAGVWIIAINVLFDLRLCSLIVDFPITHTVICGNGLLGLKNVFEYFSFGWLDRFVSLLLGSGSLCWGSVISLCWCGIVFNGHFVSDWSLLLLFKFLELFGKLLLGGLLLFGSLVFGLLVVVGLNDEVFVIIFLFIFRIWLFSLCDVFSLSLFNFLLKNKFLVLFIWVTVWLIVIIFILFLWWDLLLLRSRWLNLLLLFLGSGLFDLSCLLLFGGLLFLGHFLLSLCGTIVIGLGNGCWSRLLFLLDFLLFILWSGLFCSVVNYWFNLFLLWGLLNDRLLLFLRFLLWLFSFWLRSRSCFLFVVSRVLENCVITIAGVVFILWWTRVLTTFLAWELNTLWYDLKFEIVLEARGNLLSRVLLWLLELFLLLLWNLWLFLFNLLFLIFFLLDWLLNFWRIFLWLFLFDGFFNNLFFDLRSCLWGRCGLLCFLLFSWFDRLFLLLNRFWIRALRGTDFRFFLTFIFILFFGLFIYPFFFGIVIIPADNRKTCQICGLQMYLPLDKKQHAQTIDGQSCETNEKYWVLL